MIIQALYWKLVRRNLLRYKLCHFKADFLSNATRSTNFEGYNKLHGSCSISNSSLGLFTYASASKICNAEIGRFCSIAPNVKIGGGKHPTKFPSTHPAFYSTRAQSGKTFTTEDHYREHEKVIIGNDVWIGSGAIILDGVTIGDGVIVAAGAVVSKNIPPYHIVGGIPARHIKKRFSDEHIEGLLRLKWWDWPIEKLSHHLELFQSEDSESLDKLLQLHHEDG